MGEDRVVEWTGGCKGEEQKRGGGDMANIVGENE